MAGGVVLMESCNAMRTRTVWSLIIDALKLPCFARKLSMFVCPVTKQPHIPGHTSFTDLGFHSVLLQEWIGQIANEKDPKTQKCMTKAKYLDLKVFSDIFTYTESLLSGEFNDSDKVYGDLYLHVFYHIMRDQFGVEYIEDIPVHPKHSQEETPMLKNLGVNAVAAQQAIVTYLGIPNAVFSPNIMEITSLQCWTKRIIGDFFALGRSKKIKH